MHYAGSSPGISFMCFTEDMRMFQRNVQSFPALLDILAEDLGVTTSSLAAIGVGWNPRDSVWVFPERDSNGEILGLVYRKPHGGKYSATGSKRGLTYEVNPRYTADAEDKNPGWTRCDEDYPCPICGETRWCMVSSEDPSDPQAVMCGRTAAGAVRRLGSDAGYLHIRKEAGNLRAGMAVLPPSLRPILVVEGQTDTAAGLDLGFQAIGKPSASGGHKHLPAVVAGRDVIVIGENDSGAGKLGMERTFETIKAAAKSVVKLMPPDGIKDLRAWVGRGLTAEMLLAAVAEAGDTKSASNLLESIAPLDLAENWLKSRHWAKTFPILRMYSGEWYRFNGIKFAPVMEKPYIRGDLYSYFADKTYAKPTKDGPKPVSLEMNAARVSNIIDACSMTCPVYDDAPCWLDGTAGRPEPANMVGFENGLLTLPAHSLRPNTSAFFTLTAMPYAWNPGAECPLWLKFLGEAFPGDTDRRALLQEWFGYNMVADMTQEKLMFFIGRPGAGKSTVLDVLRSILGADHTASTSFDKLTSEFGLQPLVGALAAIMSDAHMTRASNPTKALQVLKEISGGDRICINRKKISFLRDHRLSCRFTISVNAMPDLPDHERALDRRMLLLHFKECFNDRADTMLKDKLVQEAPGIAVWALQGLARLRQQGFTTPETSGPVLAEFRRQSSPITEFVEDCCIMDESQVQIKQVYDAYRRWSLDQGLTPGSQAQFVQRTKGLYPGIEQGKASIGGRQVRCWFGLRLTDVAVEQYIGGR